MNTKLIWITFILILLILITLFFRFSPPSPLYVIKLTREYMQSTFIFGDEDKTYWHLTLAEKRLSEAVFLKNKIYILSDLQKKEAEKNAHIAEQLLNSLKDKTNTTYLEDKLASIKLELGKF